MPLSTPVSELNPFLSLLICLILVYLINYQSLQYSLLGKPGDTLQT